MLVLGRGLRRLPDSGWGERLPAASSAANGGGGGGAGSAVRAAEQRVGEDPWTVTGCLWRCRCGGVVRGRGCSSGSSGITSGSSSSSSSSSGEALDLSPDTHAHAGAVSLSPHAWSHPRSSTCHLPGQLQPAILKCQLLLHPRGMFLQGVMAKGLGLRA